jgi:DNA-binding response OmpR family regulator
MTRVLIVEDDAFLGHDLKEQLTKAGLVVIGVATSVRTALDFLNRVTCDIAVLDVNLGRETSVPIAAELKAQGIPFVLATGYSTQQIPKGYNGAMIFQKPIQTEVLVGALQSRRRK